MRFGLIGLVAIALTVAETPSANAAGLKSSYKYEAGDKKTLIILQTPHTREKLRYSFLGFEIETKSYSKNTYISSNPSHEFLLEGQKRKDERPFDYIKIKAKPQSYVQHLSYTNGGTVKTYCNNRGAYVFNIEPGKVNVLSAVPSAYMYNGTQFTFTPEAESSIKMDIVKRLERYSNIIAPVVYAVPTHVVTFENNPKVFKAICPTEKFFKIESGTSDAAKVAAGLLPQADPT